MTKYLAITILFIPQLAFGLLACDKLADHLKSCSSYSCTHFNFLYPFILTTHQVIGLKDGKCHYQQTLPLRAKMTCEYSDITRNKIAKVMSYYKAKLQNTPQDNVAVPDGSLIDENWTHECFVVKSTHLPNLEKLFDNNIPTLNEEPDEAPLPQ